MLPAALAGLAFERPIERRLGGPLAVGLAQLAAGLALVAADRRGGERAVPDPGDHLAVGVAQAAALIPGRLPRRRGAHGGRAGADFPTPRRSRSRSRPLCRSPPEPWR